MPDAEPDTIQKVCEWCLLPKFGENRCICDSAKFSRMQICEECGEYKDVDKIREADGQYVCPGCELEVLCS